MSLQSSIYQLYNKKLTNIDNPEIRRDILQYYVPFLYFCDMWRIFIYTATKPLLQDFIDRLIKEYFLKHPSGMQLYAIMYKAKPPLKSSQQDHRDLAELNHYHHNQGQYWNHASFLDLARKVASVSANSTPEDDSTYLKWLNLMKWLVLAVVFGM